MKLIFLFFCLFQFLLSFSQKDSNFLFPNFRKNDTIIKHEAYYVSFNSTHNQANWIAYQLTKDECIKKVERKTSFKSDPLIPNTNHKVDYSKSGFDKGHLAPAADMSFSEIAMTESFYFSNISPHNPSFNRGIWKKLEEETRVWANTFDSIYIVVGPILHDSLCKIGPNKISVPQNFYKVILDFDKQNPKIIAFYIENENSKNQLKNFVITVDTLERITEIDFFPYLPDEIEQKLESEICLTCWGL